jgi:hypothetical protein
VSIPPGDPFVVVLEEPGARVVGTTEVIKNNLNPEFTTAIQMDYFFERTQQLVFRVYDSDTGRDTNVAKADFLGETTVTLAELVVRKLMGSGGPLTKCVQSNPRFNRKLTPSGILNVSASEIHEGASDNLSFSFRLVDVFYPAGPSLIELQRREAGQEGFLWQVGPVLCAALRAPAVAHLPVQHLAQHAQPHLDGMHTQRLFVEPDSFITVFFFGTAGDALVVDAVPGGPKPAHYGGGV